MERGQCSRVPAFCYDRHQRSIYAGPSAHKGFMVPEPCSPKENHILASLPREEYGTLSPHLESVFLPAGSVLYDSLHKSISVYFPINCTASLIYSTADGASPEIAVIGHEGMAGIALIIGDVSPWNRTIVQSAGFAYRLRASLLRSEFERIDALRRSLLQYISALMTQIGQTAVCNRFHSVEQQLCRWLLMHTDRLRGDELVVTQERIATLLGVRREGISAAAASLQDDGAIRYHRGRIAIVDRQRLEARVCECYAAIRNRYDLLPSRVAVRSRSSA